MEHDSAIHCTDLANFSTLASSAGSPSFIAWQKLIMNGINGVPKIALFSISMFLFHAGVMCFTDSYILNIWNSPSTALICRHTFHERPWRLRLLRLPAEESSPALRRGRWRSI